MFPRSPTGAYRLPALARGWGGTYLIFVLAYNFHVEALIGGVYKSDKIRGFRWV